MMDIKSKTWLLFSLIYLTATALSVLGFNYVLDSGSFLLDLFCADLIFSFVIFLFCAWFDNFSINDPAWTIRSTLFSIYYLTNARFNNNEHGGGGGGGEVIMNHMDARTMLVFALVNFWSVRLTTGLFVDKIHDIRIQDWRFTRMRDQFNFRLLYLAFALVFIVLLPTVVIFFGCMPMYYVFRNVKLDESNIDEQVAFNLNLLDLLALIVTLGGILIEGVADHQLAKFLNQHQHQQQKELACMDRGLWSLSRHPNYFGEIAFWFGLYIFGLASGAASAIEQVYSFYLLALILGPLGVFCIMYFASLPLMEERQLKRRALFYPDYMKRVPFKLLPINFKNYKPFEDSTAANNHSLKDD